MTQSIPDPADEEAVGQGDGSQFIHGCCVSNDDCSTGCCDNSGGSVGICFVLLDQLENRKEGCDFVDPNIQETISAVATEAQAEEQAF